MALIGTRSVGLGIGLWRVVRITEDDVVGAVVVGRADDLLLPVAVGVAAVNVPALGLGVSALIVVGVVLLAGFELRGDRGPRDAVGRVVQVIEGADFARGARAAGHPLRGYVADGPAPARRARVAALVLAGRADLGRHGSGTGLPGAGRGIRVAVPCTVDVGGRLGEQGAAC
jgi:hypothetical protein